MVESLPNSSQNSHITTARIEDYHQGEHVDCLDTINKWCNGEIREIDCANKKVFIHYSGFAAKYDEWIHIEVAEGETLRI